MPQLYTHSHDRRGLGGIPPKWGLREGDMPLRYALMLWGPHFMANVCLMRFKRSRDLAFHLFGLPHFKFAVQRRILICISTCTPSLHFTVAVQRSLQVCISRFAFQLFLLARRALAAAKAHCLFEQCCHCAADAHQTTSAISRGTKMGKRCSIGKGLHGFFATQVTCILTLRSEGRAF